MKVVNYKPFSDPDFRHEGRTGAFVCVVDTYTSIDERGTRDYSLYGVPSWS